MFDMTASQQSAFAQASGGVSAETVSWTIVTVVALLAIMLSGGFFLSKFKALVSKKIQFGNFLISILFSFGLLTVIAVLLYSLK